MTGHRLFRSADQGPSASKGKNSRRASRIVAASALSCAVLLAAHAGLTMRQAATELETVRAAQDTRAWDVPLLGLVKGLLPEQEEHLSTSTAVPGGSSGTDIAVREEDTVPEGVITEWYGGQAMDAVALRRTLAYVTSSLRPDGMWCSKKVHDLLMETAAVETALGYLVRQQNGPALSVWQILGFNFVEIREYFAKKDPKLLERAMRFYNSSHSEEWNRIHNIPWTAAMSLLFYEKATRGTFLVKLDTLDSRGRLWKDIYNTRLGKGTVKRYKQRALEYVHVAMSGKAGAN
ncbi:MAG: hypothetical protein Q4F72_09995 [Desulfovibrionaceae bacterium]|nr:hypothetical protein [Desulfovibrionaceae bacterium]